MDDKEYNFLIEKVKEITSGSGKKNEKLQKITELLKNRLSYYDWVGFYMVDKESNNELTLGPFSGAPTEHTQIPFGEGICGQAADTEDVFIVQDVSKETNYLSCSSDVKSEIVVPIFKQDKVVGEIDIDSHSISPFTDKDRDLLERIAEIISSIL